MNYIWIFLFADFLPFMFQKSIILIFMFGFLLSYKYYWRHSIIDFSVKEFTNYGILTFGRNGGGWKYESFVPLIGNYSVSHQFMWGEPNRNVYDSFHSPLVLQTKIQDIPVVREKLGELALQGYGIDQYNLEDYSKIRICLRKFISLS
jgi:hypothetical protein